MIYTITLNPSLDYITTVQQFTCGTINRTTEEHLFPGGKGVNVSMVLKNLGMQSTALGFSAGFTGEELKRLLEEKEIRTDFIPVKEGMTRINVKIRSDQNSGKNGEETCRLRQETELNGIGPVILPEDIQTLYQKLDALREDDVLVLAGSIPSAVPQTIYMDMMRYVQDKQIRIVVDAANDLLVNVLPYHPFLVKPNHHELGEIFGVTLTKKEEVIRYAKKLQEMGAQNVLVSMAGDGAVLLTENSTVYQAEAPKGTVVNSVGAGDSMVAGFLAGYLASDSYEQAFYTGVCAGSASAFSEELATAPEVKKLLKTFR